MQWRPCGARRRSRGRTAALLPYSRGGHVELEAMGLGEQHDGRVQVEQVAIGGIGIAAKLCFCLAVGRGVEAVGRLLEREKDRLRIPARLKVDGHQLIQSFSVHVRPPCDCRYRFEPCQLLLCYGRSCLSCWYYLTALQLPPHRAMAKTGPKSRRRRCLGCAPNRGVDSTHGQATRDYSLCSPTVSASDLRFCETPASHLR